MVFLLSYTLCHLPQLIVKSCLYSCMGLCVSFSSCARVIVLLHLRVCNYHFPRTSSGSEWEVWALCGGTDVTVAGLVTGRTERGFGSFVIWSTEVEETILYHNMQEISLKGGTETRSCHHSHHEGPAK